MAIPDSLANLRDYPVQIGELAEKFRLAVIQIDLDGSLSLAGKTAKVNELAQRYMAEIDRLWQAAEADKAALEAAIDKALSKPTGDPTAELARQVKYQRIWARVKGLLDTYGDSQSLHCGLSDLIQKAAEERGLDTLSVLIEEAPAYLTTRRMPSLWDAVNPSVQAALIAHATPQERQALKAMQELEIGWPRLAAAFGMVRKAIQQRATVGVLPGWSENERITLDMPVTMSKP